MIKKFFSTINSSWDLIKFNWLSAVLFSIIYTAGASLVMLALYRAVEKLLLLVAGVSHIADDTFGKIFLNPINWAIIIACLVVMGFIIMVQISGLLFIFDCSKKGIKLKINEALYMSLKNSLRIFKIKNWGFVIWTVIAIPFAGIMGFSSVALSIKLPDFAQDWLLSDRLIGFLYIIAMAVLFFVIVGRVLVFPSFILEDTDFTKASKKCDRLINKNFFRVLLNLLVAFVLLYLAFAIIYAVGYLIISLVGISGDTEIVSHLKNNWYMIVSIVISVLSPLLMYALVSSLYYKINKEKGEETIEVKKETSSKKDIIITDVIALLIVAVSTVFLLNIGAFNLGVFSSNLTRPYIVAHRGDSVNCPENTMPAFLKAIEEGADFIELDVHETKDGVIVVTHDDGLKRITGSSEKVHNLTYEELEKLDAGSWFSEEFSYVRISTLDEVLKALKGKALIQIELKPTKYDVDLEQKVVDIINSNDMESDCMITSLDYDALKEVKEIDPDIDVVCVMTVVSGNLDDLDFADGFSIESNNITREIVSKIHADEKEVYSWTVNNKNKVQEMINAGVDGILTDNPEMLFEALDNADYIGGFGLFLKYLAGAN